MNRGEVGVSDSTIEVILTSPIVHESMRRHYDDLVVSEKLAGDNRRRSNVAPPA
jgi:hypothetical protein